MIFVSNRPTFASMLAGCTDRPLYVYLEGGSSSPCPIPASPQGRRLGGNDIGRMWRSSVLRSIRIPCSRSNDATPTHSSSRQWFASAGKHRHRLKYAGSGRKKREVIKAERSRYGREEIVATRLDSGMGWRGPVLFLGLAPLLAWLATVYVKPDLRRELIQAVTMGPKEADKTDSTST